ncbi:MAG TPA: alginate lyase family protein [Nitrospira sp.]|nr:alginate lyase family protein [Nitrospira sp.]
MLPAINQHATGNQTDRRTIFMAPFCDLTADTLLEHFRTRATVHYFPVPDAVETARPRIDDILNNRFEFNGESHSFPTSPLWLTNLSSDREWLILLHKFYYAVGLGIAYHETDDAQYAEKWVDLTSSWVKTVPLDFLPSDVAGRRIQNWIFAHYYFVNTSTPHCVTPEFYLAFLESLHSQIAYLRDHVTPARNHRTLELCALFLAAIVFPEFTESNEWLAWSRDELVRNIQSDLLPDGVHCEQSTDYHHLVLKNYLWITRLARLNQIEMPEPFDTLVKRALTFALYSHRPDGLIPALSDGDSRCFLDLLQKGYELYGGEDLLYVASRGNKGQPPAARSKGFADSGYYILRSGWGDQDDNYQDERYLIFDCGPLGAGNHGHLDLLNLEASAFGKPLIVDPGRYTYDESGPINWRVHFRGTAYHNTVLVDRRNQTSYAWRKNRFKISGPEPDRELVSFVTEPKLDYLHGIARSHEYPVTHERKVLFIAGEYWIIVDLLRAQESHRYDLLFHLSPMAEGQVSIAQSNRTLVIQSPQLLLVQPLIPSLTSSIETGFVSTSYGKKELAPIIQLTQQASCACFFTVVYPYKKQAPSISIHSQNFEEDGRMLLDGKETTIPITITHEGHDSHDTILFTNQATREGEPALKSIEGHVQILRTDHSGRLLFCCQA